jgi:hypothetical protein
MLLYTVDMVGNGFISKLFYAEEPKVVHAHALLELLASEIAVMSLMSRISTGALHIIRRDGYIVDV